jgi:hypothetical protein
MLELRYELLTLPVRALFEALTLGSWVYLFVAYLTTLLSYSDYMSSNEINTG